MRYRRAFGNAVLVVSAVLAIPATAEASAGSPISAARPGTDKVIIVLRQQFAGLPDTPGGAARRSAVVATSQRGVLAELAAAHAHSVKPISLVNAVAATVSPAVASRLAANPAVAEVVPDQRFSYGSAAPRLGAPDKAHPLKPLPGACPARKNAVQLDPEAVEAIHAATQSGKGDSAQALGYTGAGVKVAFIADGADPDNPDFIRANGQHVYIDNRDFSGTGSSAPTDGSEAFLDASSVAAQGRHVYDVSHALVRLTVPCRIRVLGVDPGASLVGLNVIGSAETVFTSVFLEAIDYAVTADHVNVINESFGFHKYPDTDSTDLIELANDAAVKAGVVVTIASGDSGVTNTIASPASDPHTISVGATTTYRAYAQTGFGGITAPGVKGWIDNNISGLSSGGFDQSGHTVDVVAPGDLNWALCSPKRQFIGCGNLPIELEGGTSEAAPLTAGVAALVIQAYEHAHNGHRPTPALVKRIIVSTAQDIDAPAEQQGAGMIDAYAAVLAARSYRSAPKTKAGHAVVAEVTQFNAVGHRSTSERFTETLTNAGQGPVTVHMSGRVLAPYTTIASRKLHLTKARKFATRVTFHVAGGQARLNVSVALNGFGNLSLIAPNGDLAEYNFAQGESDLENAQVARPARGTWTALISDFPLVPGKTVPAEFLAQTARWRAFGTLSARSLTLPRGASRRFTLTASTPAAPGDRSGAIVLRTTGPKGRAGAPKFAQQTTIPVTLRSMAPSPGTFTGTLTGGNGRDENSGQANYYQIEVRPGTRALNATVNLGSGGFVLMFAELVSPSGLAESVASNEQFFELPHGHVKLLKQLGTDLHVTQPAAGIWTLVVDFVNPVSGEAAVTPFTVSIDQHVADDKQTGLPTSAGTKLSAGKPVTAHLTITNSTALTQVYFVDPRRAGHAWLTLASPTKTQQLPNFGFSSPVYVVPSRTIRLSAKVAAPVRNFFDLSWTFGDPDVVSSTGKTSMATFSAPQVPDGGWGIGAYRVGPDGKKHQKPVRARLSMRALTEPFDTTISSPTGDLWRRSTNLNAVFDPRLVKPGQQITIPVRINPKGAPGTVVSGTIYVASVSLNPSALAYDPVFGFFSADVLPTASNVAAFHYAYTIAGP
ncbi:MAG TPA: S8 family serine peptidase [Streptosporangiaceae bacterium]|nr:S8 family serine peptidase [Streptosporangiaceae bacterium]